MGILSGGGANFIPNKVKILLATALQQRQTKFGSFCE